MDKSTTKEVDETRALMAIPEPQRSQYVEAVITSLIEGVKNIVNKPLLQQRDKLKQIQKELEEKRPIIEPALLYTVKGGDKPFQCPKCQAELTIHETNFREFYISLMRNLEKEFESPKAPE